jgi:RHS repeat-associated protein
VATDQQSNLLLIDNNNPTGYAQVIEELTVQRQLLATTIYGLEPISQWRNAAQSFYHMDGHSGVRLLTAGTGIVVSSVVYDAYGQLLRSVGAVSSPLLYRGERFDPILRQYYLRARFYDPAKGRFTRQDPLAGQMQEPLSFHRYLYADGDPVNGIDPTGLLADSPEVTVSVGTGIAIDIAVNIVALALFSKLFFFGFHPWVAAAAEALAGAETLTQPLLVRVATAIATAIGTQVRCPCEDHERVFPNLSGHPKFGVIIVGPDTETTQGGFKSNPLWYLALQAAVAPPGQVPVANRFQRGHLVARVLGGSNDVDRNMIPQGVESNRRQYQEAEGQIRQLARDGHCLVAIVLATYGYQNPWKRVPTSTIEGYVSLPGPWPQVAPRVFAPIPNPVP